MRRFSAHLGYLFSELPLRERFFAARQSGFDGVEHPTPYAASATDVSRWLKEIELPFVQMALPSGDPARGEKGIAALPDRKQDFRAGISRGLDYAGTIGCGAIHVMSGVRQHGIADTVLWDTYIDNIAAAADAAAARGMLLLLEPIGPGTIADYIMDTPDRALRAVGELGRANVRLIFDVFHVVNAGLDPIPFIREHADLIHHMHLADYPGRHEPGSGTIDFPAVYAALDDAGFSGFFGCEYVPAGRTQDGLSWLSAQRAAQADRTTRTR